MIKKIAFLVLLCFTVVGAAQDYQYPVIKDIVTDNAGIFEREAAQALRNKLTNFETETTTQLVVLTINSLNGQSIEDFANKTFNQNKLGQAKEDNGILILFSNLDREVRIEVGYGLEPYITDIVAKRIIEDTMIPEFKEGAYFTGINKATDQLINFIKNPEALKKFKELIKERDRKQERIANILLLTFGFFFLITGCFVIYISGKKGLKIFKKFFTERVGLIFFTINILVYTVYFCFGVVLLAIIILACFKKYGYQVEPFIETNFTLIFCVSIVSFIATLTVITIINLVVKNKTKLSFSLFKSDYDSVVKAIKSIGSGNGGSGGFSSSYSSYSSSGSSSSSSSFSGGGGSSGGGGASGSW
ncbi:TPM domain-containing protein [Cellulophaga omnivescoria]|uniref:TPM domain-containing protein n=1 Tax=Cellulophaga omnivescoria TaxID=1888890 RepID=UPI0022F0FB7F|nr:TPM domain-containing protein [Cellulophaga omnivescoria]WBU90246.1 TPM domain-containing protein [Cellulophaga omnivescoria]